MKKWVIALIIGVALLSFGSGAGGNDSNLIYCGSDIMSPGDVCEETKRGSVTTRTYEEMKESDEAGKRIFNSWGRWALLGGGTVLTVLGIAGIVAVRRRRRNAGPTTADLHLAQYAQQGQGYSPGQPHPQAAQPQPAQANYPQQVPHALIPHQQQVPHQQQAPYPSQPNYPQQAQYPPQNFGPTGPQN